MEARGDAWNLRPPRVKASAEVGLSPGAERDLALSIVDVGEGEGERSRATDDLALVVVLRAVARAHEFVLGLVPRDDAAEVGADRDEAVVRDGLVLLNDEVSGVALEALDELALADLVGLEPALEGHVVAERVLRDDAAATTADARGVEVVEERATEAANGRGDRTEEDEVHHVALLHVRDLARSGHLARRGRASGASREHARRRERRGASSESEEKSEDLHCSEF